LGGTSVLGLDRAVVGQQLGSSVLGLVLQLATTV
jgi:hypothetical protein